MLSSPPDPPLGGRGGRPPPRRGIWPPPGLPAWLLGSPPLVTELDRRERAEGDREVRGCGGHPPKLADQSSIVVVERDTIITPHTLRTPFRGLQA
eukprot:8633156-Pyramimonas_sp.AAC.1